MATQTMSNNGGSITCSSCQMTVVQSPGTRRTICPHCGNFYDPALAASVSQRRHDRPKPEDDPRYPQVGYESSFYKTHVFMFCVRIVLDYQRTSIKPPVSLCTGLADPEIGGRVERNMKSVQPCPFAIITAHDGSCGKVMFSQVSVSHSVHGLGGVYLVPGSFR